MTECAFLARGRGQKRGDRLARTHANGGGVDTGEEEPPLEYCSSLETAGGGVWRGYGRTRDRIRTCCSANERGLGTGRGKKRGCEIASKCRRALCVGFGPALQNDRAPPQRKGNELSPGEGDDGGEKGTSTFRG